MPTVGRPKQGKPKQGTTLRNWSRNHACSPAAVLRPESEEQVAEVLAGAAATGERVKPIGALHSWSDAAMTDGSALSLDGMNRVLAVDAEKGTVRVQAGIRLKELLRVLQVLGLTLPVRGSIAEQSLAGAIATATHGSAPGLGHLGTLVTAMRLVTPDGTVHTLSRRGMRPGSRDLFAAARVSLGALGVVTELTISVVPDFVLEERTEPISVREALGDFDAIRTSAPFVKLWWAPHTDRVLVFRYRRTDREPSLSPRAAWVDEKIVNRYVLAGLTEVERRVPVATPYIMRTVRPLYLTARTRTGRAADILGLAMPPVHGESDYAIPVARGAEALERLVALVDRERLKVGFIQEFRFVAGDDAWLSPMYQRSSCNVGILVPDTTDTDPFQAGAERLLQSLGGRPHWGKQFTATRDYLEQAYPRYADFAALREEVDPTGVMRNAFLDRVFGPA